MVQKAKVTAHSSSGRRRAYLPAWIAALLLVLASSDLPNRLITLLL